MIIEVSQHGIIVQTLLKVLLLTSSCCSLKKKSACFLPWTFKVHTYEPNQHFNVLWVGLLVSLFLFSLPDQPRGVYTVSPLPPAWLSFTCCFFLGWSVAETLLLVSTVRWDVCGVWRDWRNKNIFLYVCVCVVLAGEGIPEVAQTFPWTLLSSKKFAKIRIWKSASAWKCFSMCLNPDEMAQREALCNWAQ